MNSKMDDCTQVKNNLVKCFHNKPLLVIVHDMINLMSSFTIVKKSTTRNTTYQSYAVKSNDITKDQLNTA